MLYYFWSFYYSYHNVTTKRNPSRLVYTAHQLTALLCFCKYVAVLRQAKTCTEKNKVYAFFTN